MNRARPGRRILSATLAGSAVAALSWALGLDPGHVTAIGLVVAAVTAAVGLLPLAVPLFWPEDVAAESGTGWHQVALTAATLGQIDRDPDRIGSLVTRLRALAVCRLGRAGVPWGDPRARELLGNALVEVLDGRRPPPAATRLVAETLDRLDRVDVAGAARARGGGAP